MSISAIPKFRVIKPQNSVQSYSNNSIKLHSQPVSDCVSFTGQSAPSMYKTTFQYLATKIIDGNKRKYKVDGSLLSASKITDAIEQLKENDTMFPDFKRSQSSKIRWKQYIPQDIRDFSIDKINEARVDRMEKWKNFLDVENPDYKKLNADNFDSELYNKLKNDDSLRFVVWNAVTGELGDNNRHIPVPLNKTALLETIKGFENILPKDRAVRCSAPSFIDIYTHRLRDNLLIDMGLSEKESVWVKIPSFAHDKQHKEENINKLETLSCKNWCTRSSVDKAIAALEDGDFHIYLERNKYNLWEPMVGMTSCRGKIDQIQGVENNNIVPLNLCDEIENYIKTSKLSCASGIIDEGPKASVALMISRKLNEVDPQTKKSFAKTIKEDNPQEIFKFLGVKTNVADDGMLEIGTYKPSYNTGEGGIIVPYSMYGIDEDLLLKNVRKINGDLILDNVNSVQNSRISKFPPNLESVKGKVSCTKEQFERFHDDILRVLDGQTKRLFIHSQS